MHSFWPSPAKTAGLTANANAQQLSAAEHLHYQQLLRHQIYQQQLNAANGGNPYQLSYNQMYKNEYFHVLASQQAFAASMAAANNLMNSTTNQNVSTNSTLNSLVQQPNVNNTLLNSTASNNINTATGQTNSTINQTNLTPSTDSSNNLTNLTNVNPLSTFAAAAAYNAQLEQTAALRAASASSSSRSSAFQFNCKKRALSSASGSLEMNLIDSLVRNSSSSLHQIVRASSRSHSATGSMGHLTPSFNLINSPTFLPNYSGSPLLGLQAHSPLSGSTTPNNLNALTSLTNLNGYHHSAFTPHSGINQNNLQLHYNLFMPKMDYNGNSSSLSNQNNGQTMINKSSLANATSNLLFKNSTIELSPVSNSNSPKTNLTNSTNESGSVSNSSSSNSNRNHNSSNAKKQSSSNENTSSDEVVSSTSLDKKKTKKHDEIESTNSSSNSGNSPNNNGLSSSRSSQHSDSSDIAITNSTKDEPNETTLQATCCLWEGCGPLEFNDHMELVRHVTSEHINKDRKAPHICRWPDCPRKLKPFKANYMLDVHIRCKFFFDAYCI